MGLGELFPIEKQLVDELLDFTSGGQGESAWRMALCAYPPAKTFD
jgi:hypothetical protein